ncbi:hypothetical protein BH09BAC5_BH09BAC5_00310 [soil metagenome]
MIFAVGNLDATANDANLVSISPATGSATSYVVLNNSVTFKGIIRNEGTTPITAITLKYSDESGIHADYITGINVAASAEYSFTHSATYLVRSYGAHVINMWVELQGDNNPSNNAKSITIEGVAFTPVHHVTVEEATGTWCGWCVRGIVFLDSMRAIHPTDCDLIAVHDGDPMVYATYDNGVGGLIQGYPSTLINRDLVSDPQYIFMDYNNTIGDFGTADLNPVVTYNSTTRQATVVVSATFAVALSGDYRLACVFTEDNVHSTAGGTWDQHNYYSYQSQNIALVDHENGMNFQTLPATIPSAQMYYNYVARTILGGFNGMASSLPTTITINSTQSYTFHYTIPASYNPANMRVVVLLIDNTTSVKHIMNSASGDVLMGINSPTSISGIDLFPNPSNENTTIHLGIKQNENVSVEVFDITGALISADNKGLVAEGEHDFYLNTSNLSQGIYFVKVTAGSSVQTIKMLVTH